MRSPKNPRVHARPRTVLAATALSLLPLVAACGNGDDADAAKAPATAEQPAGGATVTFTSPADGDRIAGSVDLQMVAEGVIIEEAGEVREGAGHLHVTTTGECVPEGQAIPKDADHVHFGKGQLEDRLYLMAGTHELCLQVGDGAHVAQPITETLTVTVGVETVDEWCAVSNEIDELGVVGDDPNTTIDEMHTVASNAAALADQLQHSIELVDESDRDDVAVMIDHFLGLTTAITGAPDVESSNSRTEEFYDEMPQAVVDGSEWVDVTCKAG